MKCDNRNSAKAVLIAVLALISLSVLLAHIVSENIFIAMSQAEQEKLPKLDSMYVKKFNKLNAVVDDYGHITVKKLNYYKKFQQELGINLLDSELTKDNQYVVTTLKTDNKDYAKIRCENFILGDTKNYKYIQGDSRYTYDRGEEYLTPISLDVAIMLSKEQKESGLQVEYLGMYKFKESYLSARGYKVNIVEDTASKNGEENISQKIAVFVADGVQYTIEGRTSLENIKAIVDSMELKNNLGLSFTVKNATKTGATLIFNQSNAKPTAELITGEYYEIEKLINNNWEKVKIKISDLGWNDVAYKIKNNDTTEMKLDWSKVYGELSSGRYKISKEVTDFREAGDFDEYEFYAEFVL
ncbi:immunoglobulin-like domain-containing protein [Criibacterium bergeronii]|uniref:immunoglobulin-like domain-containing protein n=1 Tax=Criibacterium bergeronii TaxID=1871336 RepID=UPI00082778D2|nr:immunoglobulin-like domain-containing protein [Criibacterium bergeronii]MBS6063185.1 hypothetical protein [Peptostreptococcaceae bacterium]